MLLPLFDPPRHDTKETIERCIEKGISVKMVTGDQLLIGKETAKQLGMGTNMYTTEVIMAVRLPLPWLAWGFLPPATLLHEPVRPFWVLSPWVGPFPGALPKVLGTSRGTARKAWLGMASASCLS